MNEINRKFIEFVKVLACNEYSYELWQEYAVAHYANTETESARRELVRICIDDESIGNEMCSLSGKTIEKINRILVRLRIETCKE